MGPNRGFFYTGTVGPGDEGENLLRHLASRYRHSASAQWAERIARGEVRVNGEIAGPERKLARGDRVTWERPPWEEPQVPLRYALLYRDEALLAVAKPAGLPTLPGGGFLEHTLLFLVRRRYPEASPAHRLGRGTSGVVLFARTARAASLLAETWRHRRATKVYRALVEGHPRERTFEVAVPIGPVPHPALGSVHAASPAGKPSLSSVEVLEYREGASLVEVTIATGRPHQIRIHMAACGHPLVGDPLYAAGGGFRGAGAALPGDTGYLLHALRLALPHPITGAPFEVECIPPGALRPRGSWTRPPIFGASP